jgi:hypothetical protein
MATRLKTVKYAFPILSSIADATTTNFTQITLYIPESSPSFKAAICTVMADDIITATGGTITEWRVGLRLGAASYTTNTNTNDIVNSGENMSPGFVVDFTSHFTSNWSGSSMTCDVQVYIDQITGTTLGYVNGTCELEITYEYDDTSATHVKTVEIPLDAPVGTLATSKPGTATATIPALDTFLAENSKTIRSYYIVVQGNDAITGTTDMTLSMEIDTLGVNTSGNHEAALNSDRFFRYIYSLTGSVPATNTTHSFYIWASLAKFNHLQVTLVVTYEFTVSGTTGVTNSIKVPFAFIGIPGGTTSSDCSRVTLKVWVEEPTTIGILQSAVYLFWEQVGATAYQVRVNSASFTAYTDAAATVCGSVACMYRCESAITLARGLNTITIDVYRTTTTLMGPVSGVLLLNYSSGVSSQGIGAHNHTVVFNVKDYGTAAGANLWNVSAMALGIPESSYFINSFGFQNTTIQTAGATVLGTTDLERLSAEGGVTWDSADNRVVAATDNEVGVRIFYQNETPVVKQFPSDLRKWNDLSRLDIETSRRYRVTIQGIVAGWVASAAIVTYHSIGFTVGDSVSGSGGGTVNLYLQNSDGVRLLSTSRVGNGTFSFTWYDNTANVYVDAYEDTTHLGRSEPGTATGSA